MAQSLTSKLSSLVLSNTVNTSAGIVNTDTQTQLLMPDRKTVKLNNGDRVAIYKPLRGLSKKDRAKHQKLIEAAERRQAKRTWEDNKPLTKVPWGFLLLWALMILL